MNWTIKFAINIGWVKIDNPKVKKWISDKNVDLLAFTLKKGLYPERIQAIKGLTKLRDKSIIPELLQIGRSDFEIVAKEAISAIEQLNTNLKYKSEVEKLKGYWKIRSQKDKTYQTKRKVEWIDKQSRMKNLERLKQQLKKPINGGGWF